MYFQTNFHRLNYNVSFITAIKPRYKYTFILNSTIIWPGREADHSPPSSAEVKE